MPEDLEDEVLISGMSFFFTHLLSGCGKRSFSEDDIHRERQEMFFFLFLTKIKNSVNMSHKAQNRENLLNHVK